MHATTAHLNDPQLAATVTDVRNRFGRTGLIALVQLCHQELARAGDDDGFRTLAESPSLVGP